MLRWGITVLIEQLSNFSAALCVSHQGFSTNTFAGVNCPGQRKQIVLHGAPPALRLAPANSLLFLVRVTT